MWSNDRAKIVQKLRNSTSAMACLKTGTLNPGNMSAHYSDLVVVGEIGVTCYFFHDKGMRDIFIHQTGAQIMTIADLDRKVSMR